MKKIDIKNKKRIVVKVGTHALTHSETGYLDYIKIERLVRELCNLHNTGREVVLVTSAAIATGRQIMGVKKTDETIEKKQALAAIGQARLMSIYEKFFFEYNQISAQILMTKDSFFNDESRTNAKNTFNELLSAGVIPIVNANDTVSTAEIKFGDNDTLSAVVASTVNADLLIILSDIDGLYTANPSEDKNAKLIPVVEKINDEHISMASEKTGTSMGTGGMKTKLRAAKIVTAHGIDMIISSGMDMSNIHKIFEEDFVGTSFLSDIDPGFDMYSFIKEV